MKVKVARSVEEKSLGYCNIIVEDMYPKVGSGEVFTITLITRGGIYLTEGSLGWDWSWLEPVSNLDTFHNKVKCKYKRVCL
jgi:hypothetical protein